MSKINLFKNGLKLMLMMVVVYIAYAFITGVLLFAFIATDDNGYQKEQSVERFYGQKEGPDRVVLVEDRYQSGLTRLDLISNAEKSLDISYYTLHEGTSLDIFLASIIEAADRGVEVRILLDGLFHNLRGDLKDVIYTFYQHPNIELRLYEPLNLAKPWTFNNRLHDKFIVVDRQKVLLGGRNIGDKYFVLDPAQYDGLASNDRDVLVIKTDNADTSGSVVYDVIEYFNLLWEHEYTDISVSSLTNRQQRNADKKREELRSFLAEQKSKYPHRFEQEFDWLEESHPTKKITLIHNSITRFNKEPRVWMDITKLMEIAERSIIIQSPYLIPTSSMKEYLNLANVEADTKVLTNSIGTSSNYFAMSGHIRNRRDIVDAGADVFEYQDQETVHAKSYIFDERISLVGSFNLDSRSAFLSTETMLVIDSYQFAAQLEDEIESYIENSLLLKEDYSYASSEVADKKSVPTFKKITIRLLSYLTYFFDFML
ncbi:phosphatidylserine/phosphatidylglycerophosphate/cardiolipin synthase family protein [Proteinivorax hydrogeniformans]|uniref:Phosphatidylserine/phosphatidylglycerophosphate/ cardiolipin synthase family protein n=1 Tax=Proteinivorax hydrogeniformans TaxID=1826727 RepID=A0AAU8HTV2_9FIRM